MKSLRSPQIMSVLVFLLFVCSTSMAAISLSILDVADAGGGTTTVTIGVTSDDDSSWVGYCGYDSGASAAWNGDPVIHPEAGDLAGFDLYSVNEYELTAAGFTSLPVAGLQFELKLDIYQGYEAFDIYLQDETGAPVDALNIPADLPEPMTMALLGLGGMLIRRKKA